MVLKPKNMRKLFHSITGLVLIGGLLGFSAEASAATGSSQTTISKASTHFGTKKPKKRKGKTKRQHRCEAYNG